MGVRIDEVTGFEPASLQAVLIDRRKIKSEGLPPILIKIAPENPVLWTGMKGASAKGRKSLNQMLKQVQHDNGVWV